MLKKHLGVLLLVGICLAAEPPSHPHFSNSPIIGGRETAPASPSEEYPHVEEDDQEYVDDDRDERSLTAEEDVTEASISPEDEEFLAEDEELAPEESCNYTDPTLGDLNIKFRDSEEGLEVIEMGRRGTEGGPLEEVTLEVSVTMEDKLVECLKGDLEGRKVKRKNAKRGKGKKKKRRNSPFMLLSRMRGQLNGPMNQITVQKLRSVMRLGNRLLNEKLRQKRKRKQKQKRRRANKRKTG